MSSRKRGGSIVTTKVDLSEYFCSFCERPFYTLSVDSFPDRCPWCGSTSEVDIVRGVTVTREEPVNNKERS